MLRPIPPLALKPLTLGILATLLTTSASGATFTVTDAGDDGLAQNANLCSGVAFPCTLRAAMELANQLSDADTIEFAIGSGPVTISPASALPLIVQPLTIDGYTQPGASPNTLAQGTDAVVNVRIDGVNAADVNGLVIKSPNTRVQGLAITRFGINGIVVQVSGGNIFINGNFIGTDGSGSVADVNGTLANGGDGVLIASATGAQVGGTTLATRNLIVGSTAVALFGSDAKSTTVQGNLIGTDRTGTQQRATGDGLIIVSGASSNRILDNVIGAAQNGITINGESNDNEVQKNFVGYGADSTSSIAGSGHGVWIGDTLSGKGPQNTLVGGLGATDGNIIAHWGGWGVAVEQASPATIPTMNSTIIHNRIHHNTGGGIHLVGGANNNQPAPTFTGPVVASGGKADVPISFQGSPNTQYAVEFFGNDACHPSGAGEGQYPYVTKTIMTDASGQFTGPVSSVPVIVGETLTMTVRVSTFNFIADTSEFSQCQPITGEMGTPPVVNAIPDQSRTQNANFNLDLRGYVSATDGDLVTVYTLTGTLPNGVTFMDGILIGTPTNTGVFPLTLSAADKDGTSSPVTFHLTVTPAVAPGTPPILDAIPQQSGSLGVAFSLDLSTYATPTDGDPITYTLIGNLPPGLSFNSANGHLTGTPTATGTYSLTLIASDKDGSSIRRTFNLVVQDNNPPAAAPAPVPVLGPLGMLLLSLLSGGLGLLGLRRRS